METLNSILEFLPSEYYNETICQCACVCKNWKATVYYKLYTDVSFFSVATLTKFNRTIAESANVANMVKIMTFHTYLDENDSEQAALVYTLLSNLPNLQHFNSLYSPCLIPTTNALLDSKLTNLKNFAEPLVVTTSNDYVTCALLLKDRLETLLLAGEGVLYERLYDRLEQFKKLERIRIELALENPIEGLDLIVDKCPTVRVIEVDLENELDYTSTVVVKDSIISQLYAPRLEVISLSVSRDKGELHQSLLAYVMHKYPNLKRLRYTAEGVELTNISILERLITYIAKLESHTINTIVTNVEWICDSIGCYWEALCSRQKRVKTVSLIVKPGVASISGTTNAQLGFVHNEVHTRTTISFPFSRYNFQDMDLFAKYGQYVGNLHIQGISKKLFFPRRSVDVAATVLEKLIASAIKSSINLKWLQLNDCDISRTDENVTLKKERLQELGLHCCNVGDRVFETFFGGINLIDTLKFAECHFPDERNKLSPFISINLPNTMIGTIKLNSPKNPHRGSRYFFLQISTLTEGCSERETLYYKYDFELYNDQYFKLSSIGEYNAEKYFQCLHLKICCQSINSLLVSYNALIIRLPTTSINI